MGIDKRALYPLSYGIYVVSSKYGDRMNGQIANTVFQITSDPPRVAVSINKQNFTWEFISQSEMFSVSVLDVDTPMEFIGLFGFKSGRDMDKFSNVKYKIGLAGTPLVLDYALSVFEAKVVDRLDVGTHTIFIGEVVSSELLQQGEPLTYAFYHKVKKGRAPESAPTYRDEKEVEDPSFGKYVCDVCGYVYDPAVGDPENGVPPGTQFQNLPSDWVCPVCSAPKTEFSPVNSP